MNTQPMASARPAPAYPVLSDDEGTRELTLVDPDDQGLTHLGVVGDTYTVLISGDDTAGRYALIDMLVPPGGGPPPHRHDFEEMFRVLEGEVEVTLRGTTSIARVGETVNVPALAPHSFANRTAEPLRLLCVVSPSGLEEYFAEFGDPVASRTASAPDLTDAELATRMETAKKLALKYRIENL
jgi:mannose-6-phosphate isomerase-like protein (cupin superfamily)